MPIKVSLGDLGSRITVLSLRIPFSLLLGMTERSICGAWTNLKLHMTKTRTLKIIYLELPTYRSMDFCRWTIVMGLTSSLQLARSCKSGTMRGQHLYNRLSGESTQWPKSDSILLKWMFWQAWEWTEVSASTTFEATQQFTKSTWKTKVRPYAGTLKSLWIS